MAYTRDQALGVFGVVTSSPKVQAVLEAHLGHKKGVSVGDFDSQNREVLDQCEETVLAIIDPLLVLYHEVTNRKGKLPKQLEGFGTDGKKKKPKKINPNVKASTKRGGAKPKAKKTRKAAKRRGPFRDPDPTRRY